MNINYRALCAEMLQAWDDLPWEYDISPLAKIDDTPFERARAALAQDQSTASIHTAENNDDQV